MTTTTITGPRHPLMAALADATQPWTAYQSETVGALIKHHREHGVSDQSIYRIISTGVPGRIAWSYVGPRETSGHLLNQAGYITVTTPRGDRSTSDTILGIGSQIWPRNTATLRCAVDVAAALAADLTITLGLLAASGAVEWDSDETVTTAALRLARDYIWQAYQVNSVQFAEHTVTATPAAHWSGLLGSLGIAERTPAECAGAFLANREQVRAGLAERGIEWGGRLLSDQQVGNELGISAATWRAYVSRGQAPSADQERPTRWQDSTIHAYRLTRNR